MAKPFLRYLASNVALAAAYVGAGIVGLLMAFEHGSVSPVWPPSGIALAGLLLLGLRFWPGVLLGALFVNLTTAVSVPTACLIAIGNTAEAVLGAWLLRRVVRIDESLTRVTDVLGLLVCGAMLSTTTSATVGVLSLCLESGVHWPHFGRLWWEWWVGDAMGDLIVAPLILAWASGTPGAPSRRRAAEAAVLTVGLLLACSMAFGPGGDVSPIARPFFLFPLLIWAALRFELRGVTLVMAVASIFAVAGTLQGYGPYGATTLSSGLVVTQAFLGVTAVTGLILAAVTSERRRATDVLRESDERYRAVVTQSADGIFLADVETKHVLNANPAMLRLVGYDRHDMRQLTLYDFVAHDRESIDRNTRRIVKEKHQLLGERRYRRKDGTLVDVEVRANLITVGEREVMCVIAREISERKRTEEALRRSEEQARQSQKLEAIGRVAGGVAHDFNNILTVILGYSNILLARSSDGTREALEEIKRSGERAAALTQQLLAFSRKQVLQPKVVNLNMVVADMGKMLTRLIGADIEFTVTTEPALGSVLVDPGQIEQVIMNLTVNARDAMPEGGTLTISTAEIVLDANDARRPAGSEPGIYVTLTVSDSGHGIDAATLSKIFEPFYTTKEMGRGTGLGLATVYGIVQQSGGTIEVASEVNRGTMFRIYLPRVEEEASAESTGQWQSEMPPGTETILVAEDEPAVRGLVTRTLRHAGYTVLEAADGREAVRLYEGYEKEIHVIVTDLVMPGLGGRQFAELAMRRRPGVKVLYMSGYAEDAISGFDVGGPGMAFLPKPFTATDLIVSVRRALDADEGGV
jgi:two-component system, cell cycle sensor histidine kinase and response regulator CckA